MFGITGEAVSEYPGYSAPKQHGEKLLEPNLEVVQQRFHDELIFQRHVASQVSVGSIPLADLRKSARTALLIAAREYTGAYRDVAHVAPNDAAEIVMSGHQPDLFHCGVWFKNFVLSKLGTTLNAVPIHFIVDNDLCRNAAIQIPQIVDGKAVNRLLAFDTPAAPMPWENRRLQNVATWKTFSNRFQTECAKLKHQPLIGDLWNHAARLDTSIPLGLLLSQARHLLEQDFGLQTLELPLSQIATTLEFSQFSWAIVSQLGRFQTIYNAELDRYRTAHRIRNHAQPLPNLGVVDDWLEAPFWCYAEDSLAREPLWVRKETNVITLSDRRSWEQAFSLSELDACQQWLEVSSKGIRLRPRALTTTMYARLVLSDLFVHGIGGGKYDQITDRIVSSFFGLKLAPFLVASATMRLQFDGLPAQLELKQSGELENKRQLRKAAETNPEMLLEMSVTTLSATQRLELQSLAEQKRALLAAIPSKGEKWEWHLSMKKVKRQLSELAQPHLKLLQDEVAQLQHLSEQQSLLNSREFSFSLFSKDEIRKHIAI